MASSDVRKCQMITSRSLLKRMGLKPSKYPIRSGGVWILREYSNYHYHSPLSFKTEQMRWHCFLQMLQSWYVYEFTTQFKASLLRCDSLGFSCNPIHVWKHITYRWEVPRLYPRILTQLFPRTLSRLCPRTCTLSSPPHPTPPFCLKYLQVCLALDDLYVIIPTPPRPTLVGITEPKF